MYIVYSSVLCCGYAKLVTRNSLHYSGYSSLTTESSTLLRFLTQIQLHNHHVGVGTQPGAGKQSHQLSDLEIKKLEPLLEEDYTSEICTF